MILDGVPVLKIVKMIFDLISSVSDNLYFLGRVRLVLITNTDIIIQVDKSLRRLSGQLNWNICSYCFTNFGYCERDFNNIHEV